MRWYASKRRKEESSDGVWKSRLTEPYLWFCRAVHSRPSDPQQRRPDGRTAYITTVAWNDELVAEPNVDAAYWRYRRPVCRDPPCMAEPCTADNGGQCSSTAECIFSQVTLYHRSNCDCYSEPQNLTKCHIECTDFLHRKLRSLPIRWDPLERFWVDVFRNVTWIL